MADTAAAPALGTPDPTAIPPDIAAVAPAGTPAAIPATIAAPAAGTDMPTPMGTTPGTTLPPDAATDPEVAAGAVHQNWLSKILDTVGTILGGDKTIVATKHPDGTVTVEHNPSTTGEKWGRIAQAALGGAARGMAAGQGPGGAAKAFGAGAEAGIQMPQQALDAANKEAAAMNAQQLAIAQRALLNQQITRNGWDIAHLSRDDQQNQASISLAHAKTLQDMGAIPVAMNVKSGTELAGYGKADPLSVGAHVGVNGDMIYNEGDGQGGVNFYRIPADVAKQRTKTDDHWLEVKVDPDHPTQTIKIEHVTEAGQDLNGERLTKHMAQNVANDAAIKQAQQAKVAEQEANTKATEAQGKPALTAAETRKANAEAAKAGAETALANKQTAAIGANYVPGQNPVLDDTAEGLASGRYLQSTLPKRTGKGQPTPQEQNYAANLISQQKYGLPYNPTIIDQENTFAKAPKTQAYLEGIDRMTGAHGDPGQLNQLLNLAQAAGIGGNAPLNDIKQAVRTKLGSAAADNFATLLTETQSNLGTLIGNPLLGSGESDQKLRTAQSAFGQNPTLDSLRGQVATVTDVLNRSRANMAANNRYIQQRYGNRLSPQAAPTGTANPPTANTGGAAPPINLVPPGHDTTFANGQVWRNVNGVAQRIK
jgi:hypothetical protein